MNESWPGLYLMMAPSLKQQRGGKKKKTFLLLAQECLSRLLMFFLSCYLAIITLELWKPLRGRVPMSKNEQKRKRVLPCFLKGSEWRGRKTKIKWVGGAVITKAVCFTNELWHEKKGGGKTNCRMERMWDSPLDRGKPCAQLSTLSAPGLIRKKQ